MSRTVADAALMLDAMKGPDSRDWYSLPDDGIAYRERVREGSLKGKRVALSPTLGYAEPDAGGARGGRAGGQGLSPISARRSSPPTRSRSRRCRSSRRWRSAAFWALLRAMTAGEDRGDGPGSRRHLPAPARR